MSTFQKIKKERKKAVTIYIRDVTYNIYKI